MPLRPIRAAKLIAPDRTEFHPAKNRGGSSVNQHDGVAGRATVIYIPAAATGAVTAGGAAVDVIPGPGGGGEALVYPSGGPYQVTVAPR